MSANAFIQILLAGFALMIGILQLFANSGNVQANANAKLMKWIKMASVMVFVIIAMFSIVLAVVNNDYERDLRAEHDKEYNKTTQDANYLIQKMHSALDTLGIVLDSTKAQLQLEKRTNEANKIILSANEQLLIRQQSTYQHVDRLLNPLFPLTISIDFEFPFDSRNAKKLMKAAFEIRKMEELKTGETESYLVLQDRLLDSFLKKLSSSNQEFLLFDECSISFIKTKIKHAKEVTPATPRLMFTIGAGSNYRKKQMSVHVDFDRRFFGVNLTFDSCTLVGADRVEKTADIGFNELKNCYLLFDPYTKINNYTLSYMTLSSPTMTGYYAISPKTINAQELGTEVPNKVYYCKISDKNFLNRVKLKIEAGKRY